MSIKRVRFPDPEAFEEATRLVMRLCFAPKYRWSFKGRYGDPIGLSARQRTAVRKLAAFFPEYDKESDG